MEIAIPPVNTPPPPRRKNNCQKLPFSPFELRAQDAEEAVGAVADEADARFRALAVDVVAYLHGDGDLAVDGEEDLVGDADDADADGGFAWGDDGANR